MEGQDLSQLRRIHRRRPGTDASYLAQPEHMGNTLHQTLEQDRPRTTPSVQSRKLDRNPKTHEANTVLTPENELLSDDLCHRFSRTKLVACELRCYPSCNLFSES